MSSQIKEKAEQKLEEAKVRARSQKWGDVADKYERDLLQWKRTKLRKKGRL